MKWLEAKTREGIPRHQYRWGQLLLALVPGYLLHFLCSAIWTTMREQGPEKTQFGNAIIVLFHPEFPITLTAQTTWRKHFRGMGYLGIHNWISYLTSVICYLDALPAVRYDRRRGIKPMDQVLEFLHENPEVPFALRTDSGGPYYRVRTSIVKLALSTGRPVICLRQSVDKQWIILKHRFPKPFSLATLRVSEPISAERLAKMPIEQATALVQATMDSLEDSPSKPPK